jgi:ribosomal protein S18 acetylase RimI-like enzyme
VASQTARIRPVRPDDLSALYDIALLTGDNGQDATGQYRDGRLVGHLYAAPYAVLEPGSAFVVEDAGGVAGYIVGARDTLAFEARMEAEWWPALREEYAFPSGDPAAWTADELRAYQIHRPRPPPKRVTDPYPSHLHINLLPRLQGQGLGKRLIDRWLGRMAELGSPGAHLGVGAKNARAIRFYSAYGFTEFRFPTENPDAPALYFVTALAGG